MSTSPSTGAEQGKPVNLKPGDEAAPGTPGTGDDLCDECSGTGKLRDGAECPNCAGTGHVTSGIGGG
ncbi:hypothetical protein [Noviherbaspirillum sp.]|uniref:hypothetical protein n=1 Tax=Noviherbaspirillum sp. TaxID=1926288 RepID=UPI002FE2FA59